MRVPLHIKPTDRSKEADMERYALHEEAMHLNPRGFPVMGRNTGDTYLSRLAERVYGFAAERRPQKKKLLIEPTLNRLMRGRAAPRAPKKIKKQAA